jgi:hypothetical protein
VTARELWLHLWCEKQHTLAQHTYTP